MAATKTALAAPKPTAVTTELDQSQVLKASTALLRKIQSDQTAAKSNPEKSNLLADADEEDAEDDIPIWLILTTKKHVTDKKRLKPGKIPLPHPLLDTSLETLRICLITADPQRLYKDLIADPTFPLSLRTRITRVIGVSKLKAKYKSFESRRQLYSEYDVFLADDRIITYLPQYLGKIFYKSSSKRPVPVVLEGKRQSVDEQGNKRRKLAEGGSKVVKDAPKVGDVAREIERTLGSALVHLSPSTTTSVKVGKGSMSAEELGENVESVVAGLVEKYVAKKWAGVRALHIKGPQTAALPIYMAEELWEDEKDVLEEPIVMKESKKERKRKRALIENPDTIEVPGPDGKMRVVVKPGTTLTKRNSEGEEVEKASKKVKKVDDGAKVEKEARKLALQKQKEAAKASLAQLNGDTPKPAVTRKTRAKAADLI